MMASLSMRRRALIVRLGGAAAMAQLLAACSNTPTSAPAGAPTSAASKAATGPATTPAAAVVSKSGRVALPTYTAPNAPPPDIPGVGSVPPGYTSYPKQIVRSIADPPAKGGDITVVTQTLGTVPPPPDSNPIWAELNKRIGANLSITITPFADYGTKLPTILASNDMPDLLFLPRGQRVPGTAQFLDSKASDLTPYIGGDAVKDYPNLAALPTGVWRTTVYNGKIYGVPDALAPFFWVHWHHQELLQQAGLQPPKNGADYKNLMQTLAKPNQGLYGIVAEAGFQYGYGVTNQLFTSMFGGPNQWRLGSDGSLSRLFETDEFRQAIEYATGLWAAGLYEPGAPGYNTLSARQAFIARKGVFRWDGNTSDIYRSRGVGASSNEASGLQPPPAIRLLTPFPAQDGGKPTYPMYHGSFGMIVLKKTSEDRIKELLRVLNLLAAPFGTEERELISYGIEGRDFTRDQNGAPVINDNPGRVETMANTVNGIVNPPPVYFDPLGSDYTQHVLESFKQYAAVGVEDPTIGFYSETDTRQGLIADQRLGDGVTDIVAGRRPLSDLTQLVSDWRSNGGEQARKEYLDAMSAAA